MERGSLNMEFAHPFLIVSQKVTAEKAGAYREGHHFIGRNGGKAF